MNMDDPLHPKGGYVFIVTYGRSGSTLLQNLLNSIPGYQIRGENNNTLYHLAQAWNAVQTSDSMRRMRNKNEVSEQTHPWFGSENVRPLEVGHNLVDGFIRTVLKPDPGIRVSGFKEIRFHIHPKFFSKYLNFIHMFFPNSRFIFNTRDHSDVANSGWWTKIPPEKVLQDLSQAETLYQSYLKDHPKRCIHVHYDDYVKNPESLAPLYEFLGEEQDPEVIKRVMKTRLTHLENKKSD